MAVVGDAADQRGDEQLGRRRSGVLAAAAARLVNREFVVADPEAEPVAALVPDDDRPAADDEPAARHQPPTSIVPIIPGW